ncbi:hypothetical protein CLAIMM_07503 isoform 2 [Cladophialophora immunda]|nr:hypothetical protein CLAIMM_07503 isoform 2 [Cladophialophora immunda]
MADRGRKAKSQHSKSRVRFTDDDVWEMIAYLDYCLLFNPDHRRFKDTITSHLKTQRSKAFTLDQVDGKIQRLWTSQGIDGADHCDHHSIYHYGSKYLRCVQEDMELNAKIKARTTEIKHQMAAKFIYSNSRATRSKGLKHQHIRLGDDVDVLTPRTLRKRAADAPSEHLTDQEYLRYNSEEVPESVSQSLEDFRSFRSITMPLEPHNHLPLEAETMRGVSPSCESTDSSISTLSTPTVKDENSQSQSIADGIGSPSRFFPPPEAYIGRGQFSNGVVDVTSRLEKLKKENLWYRQELERMKEINGDLNRKLRARQAAQSIVSRDAQAGEATEQRLAECWSQIYNLESQLNNKEALLTFTRPGGKQFGRLERSEIVTDLDLIERHLSSVLVFPESKNVCTDFGLHDQQSDLQALSQRVFGRAMKVPPYAQFRHVFRSLVSAAIGMWVLESDFDDPYLQSCNLREVMLSHLTKLGMSTPIRSLRRQYLT